MDLLLLILDKNCRYSAQVVGTLSQYPNDRKFDNTRTEGDLAISELK
jgi:hypothetical protein